MRKLMIAFVLLGGFIAASAAENMAPVETLVFESKTGEKFEVPVSNAKEHEEFVPMAVRMARCPNTGKVYDREFLRILVSAITKPEQEEEIPPQLR